MNTDTTRRSTSSPSSAKSPLMHAVRQLFMKYDLWPGHVRFEYDWTHQVRVITWKIENEWHKMTVRMADTDADTLRLLEVRIKMSL